MLRWQLLAISSRFRRLATLSGVEKGAGIGNRSNVSGVGPKTSVGLQTARRGLILNPVKPPLVFARGAKSREPCACRRSSL